MATTGSTTPPLYAGRTAAHTLDIIIVGCGLGGLAAAYALGKAGHNITIVEAAPALGEVGAGIQVSPNVSRVLRSFGLGERLREVAVEPLGIMFRRYHTGEIVGRTDWTAMNEQYGSPYYHVHRADLHQMLCDAALSLPNVTLRLNATVRAYHSPGTLLVSHTTDPTTTFEMNADLVVGADGVKSLLRSAVVGEADSPRATGDAAYRAIVPAEKLLEHEDLKEFIEYPHMASWMGPGRHIMGYCIRGRNEYNLVLLHPDDGSVESWTAEGSADKMRADFAGWEPRVEKLLSFVPATLKWKLMDRAPLPTWIHADKKLVLLGDACHPMLPYRAQGAAMAIEDGAVLGALFARLTAPTQVPDFLRAYEHLRHSRTADVQASSRLNQHIFHLPDGAAQEERDGAMRETLRGAPDGGYTPSILQGKPFLPTVESAHEGNPNQWADARKSAVLFGYDAFEAVDAWFAREHDDNSDAEDGWQSEGTGTSVGTSTAIDTDDMESVGSAAVKVVADVDVPVAGVAAV